MSDLFMLLVSRWKIFFGNFYSSRSFIYIILLQKTNQALLSCYSCKNQPHPTLSIFENVTFENVCSDAFKALGNVKLRPILIKILGLKQISYLSKYPLGWKWSCNCFYSHFRYVIEYRKSDLRIP